MRDMIMSTQPPATRAPTSPHAVNVAVVAVGDAGKGVDTDGDINAADAIDVIYAGITLGAVGAFSAAVCDIGAVDAADCIGAVDASDATDASDAIEATDAIDATGAIDSTNANTASDAVDAIDAGDAK